MSSLPMAARGPVAELGTVLGVWAHPDDEAYLSGGTMAAAVETGQRVVVVTATPGERGTADPQTWPPERLGAMRRRELAASLAALGVSEHRWLGHRDGELATVPERIGVAQVAAVIEEVAPHTVLTFGPEGMTGHPDHRVISRWVGAALRQVGSPARLLHATTGGDFLDRYADVHERFDVFFAGDPPWTPPEAMALEHRLDDRLLDAKLAALRAQASQTSSLVEGMGVERFRRWFAIEYFAEGHPLEASRVA